MNQLTHEEEAKVFAAHLPCMVLCGMQIGWRLSQKTYPANLHFYVENRHRNLKLLLTPLSDITDEHAIEVGKIIGYRFDKSRPGVYQRAVEDSRKIATNVYSLVRGSESIISIYLYLISKGYAVPLWFGIDHWANGMTAIELKIAISYSEYQYTLLAKQLLHQKPAINLKS